MIKKILGLTLFSLLLINNANARDNIQVVGSSTMYPMMTLIAERFNSNNPQYKTPVVESTGSGAGISIFCKAVGVSSVDIVNSSRHIKQNEVETCKKNNVNFLEIELGYDGITIVHSKDLNNVNLTVEQLYLALAEMVPDANGNMIKNHYKKWSEIDKSLPDRDIKFLGRPATSGTFDTFVELVMQKGFESLKKQGVVKSDVDSNFGKRIRIDGPWIEIPENDNLVITRVEKESGLFGFLGYGYYYQNQNKLKAAKINGQEPTSANIESKKYPLFRTLYVYVKKNNFDIIPGLKEFTEAIVSEDEIGKNGELEASGLLIPLTTNEYNKMKSNLNFK